MFAASMFVITMRSKETKNVGNYNRENTSFLKKNESNSIEYLASQQHSVEMGVEEEIELNRILTRYAL